MDKRTPFGRIVITRYPCRRKFSLLLGLSAPKPWLAISWLGLSLQWDSPRSEQEVIKRMPKKYHHLLKDKYHSIDLS